MAGDVFRGCRVVAMLALLATAGVELVARWLHQPAPDALVLPSFASTPGWAAFALLAVMASRCERMTLFTAVLALAPIAFAALRPMFGALVTWPFCIGAGFGMAPYAVLIRGVATRPGEARRRALDLLAACSIVQVSALAMPFFLAITIPALPNLCDGALVRLDTAFGPQPSAIAALLLQRSPALGLLCKIVYGFLPVGVTVVAALEETGTQRPRIGLLPAFLVAAVLGYAAYYAMPAIGPGPFFGSSFAVPYPDLVAARRLADSDPAHVRNAMPSLHAAWAMLMLLATRRQARAVRGAAGLFLVLTALATLGLGEHYAVDLVVAMPLVLTVRALCAVEIALADARRAGALALGVSMLAGWSALVRSPAAACLPGAFSLLAMAATVSISVWAERALSRAPTRRVRPPGRRAACRVRRVSA